ncbi:MAG: chorismate synthase [Actinomycetaceae bacterium]|nr:chorismate synthase [Actinomycetaceae bacterium]
MIRWHTAGESHGPLLTGILEGIPAQVQITSAQIEVELQRRRQGYGRGARQKIETDQLTISGGIRHGKTTGAPIAIHIANAEWDKWATVMSANPVNPEELKIAVGRSDEREQARNKTLTRPRPGHADLPGALKYDQQDLRNILERASARETAMRVGLGAITKAFLKQAAGIEIVSHVTAIGQCKSDAPLPTPAQMAQIDAHPLRTLSAQAAEAFKEAIDTAKGNQDTIGGKIQVAAYNLPVGLGTHTQWDKRLDAQIAAAMMSIQAAKSVEIGNGQIDATGKAAHDQFTFHGAPVPQQPGSCHTHSLNQAQNAGTAQNIILAASGFRRTSNHAGGLEGGMTNGEVLTVEVGFKPISTVPDALTSFDFATLELAPAIHQRSDTCAVVPGAVIAEAMLALTLANALTDMFGSSTLADLQRNLAAYQERIGARLTKTREE